MAKPKPLPPRDLIESLLTYDPLTGVCRWKIKFDGRKTEIAGLTTVDGYRRIGIGYRTYSLHRIIWLLHYGEPVPEQIDHIDGNPQNNAITNLRAATIFEQRWNTRRRNNSPVGIKGIVPEEGKYAVRFRFKNKVWRVGRYDTLEEAALVRQLIADYWHGEYARHR